MCQTCGCAPCKTCGGKIKDKVCEGCKKPAAQCTCPPKK